MVNFVLLNNFFGKFSINVLDSRSFTQFCSQNETKFHSRRKSVVYICCCHFLVWYTCASCIGNKSTLTVLMCPCICIPVYCDRQTYRQRCLNKTVNGNKMTKFTTKHNERKSTIKFEFGVSWRNNTIFFVFSHRRFHRNMRNLLLFENRRLDNEIECQLSILFIFGYFASCALL